MAVDFTTVRQRASEAASILFSASQEAFRREDFETYSRLMPDFRRAKDAEKEAHAREIAGILQPLAEGAEARLEDAVAQLEALIADQRAGARRADEIGTALSILTSAILLFAL